MAAVDVRSSYETLRDRVTAVAGLDRRCALAAGGGKLLWAVGLPLLAVVAAEAVVGLPLLLRVVVIPAAAGALLWLAWRRVVAPLRGRYSLTRAAMLVESARPELRSRVVSALELYPELANDRSPFDASLVRALIRYAQDSTAGDDFTEVIDRLPARRNTAAAVATALAWVVAMAVFFGPMSSAWGRVFSSWAEARDIARRMGGATIVIELPDQPAFLQGSDVPLRIVQKGFRNDEMHLRLRRVDDETASEWETNVLEVGADGAAAFTVDSARATFECYAVSGRIRGQTVRVVVTERPRLVKLSVEHNLPAYVRRAPIVQPRSDGNLDVLFGSTVLLTVQTSKALASASLVTSFEDDAMRLAVGGKFAQGAIRADREQWLGDERLKLDETYAIRLEDEYGFENEDADRRYRLTISKDGVPVLRFVDLPHRSSADEPHVLEKDLGRVNLAVSGRDDYGISKVVLHYRIESLETGEARDEGTRPMAMGIPRAELPRLGLARVTQLDPRIGERLVFWAEAEDAYDLEPQAGPHRVRTPTYRLAVVTEEELFSEVVYRDEWSASWYDDLKVATLARRAPPPRLAPESEPASKVAQKLLDALPVEERFGRDDARGIEQYFESLAGFE